MNCKLKALIHAFGVAGYIVAVSSVIFSLDGSYDNGPTILAPITMLTLLVLSVAVVGTLIFARPVMLYIDGKKKEGINFLAFTLSWLALIFVLILFIQTFNF